MQVVSVTESSGCSSFSEPGGVCSVSHRAAAACGRNATSVHAVSSVGTSCLVLFVLQTPSSTRFLVCESPALSLLVWGSVPLSLLGGSVHDPLHHCCLHTILWGGCLVRRGLGGGRRALACELGQAATASSGLYELGRFCSRLPQQPQTRFS